MSDTSYTWNAADYARHSSAQFRFACDLIAKLRLSGGETVLDIGSGDGKVTARLAGLLPRGQIVGIDSSAEMVALARAAFPPKQRPNLRFLRMDAVAIVFSSQFDVAFSNAALHWIRDQTGVLRGVGRALKPGGRLLFQMGGQGNATAIIAALDELIRRQKWRRYFADFRFPYLFPSPSEYRSWLEESGLEAIRVELIPKIMVQRGAGELQAWIRTTWLPWLERVPEDRRNRFVQELAGHYLKDHPPSPRGSIRVKMVRLEVEAVKPSDQSSVISDQ
jgi:trans-aconitate methyltransferase